jgi:hypothetical protein
MESQLQLPFPNSLRKSAAGSAGFGSGPRLARPAFVFDVDDHNVLSRAEVSEWGIPPVPRQQIVIDFNSFASLAGRCLTGAETDWLRVAAALYAVDRFASRRPGGAKGPVHWRRSLAVTVRVIDLDLWNKAASSIIAALTVLTGDDWSLKFLQRKVVYEVERQQQFLCRAPDRSAWVCLFSGGQDSLAGAKALAAAHNGTGVLVSGHTHERLKGVQADCFKALYPFPSSVERVSCRYGFDITDKSSKMESSQRCRGWAHVSLGILAARIANGGVLNICENGVGAFNLPSEVSQLGTQNSRAMHPVFLARMAAAAKLILGSQVRIQQSAVFETKGELLKRVFRQEADVISKSISCEIFPNYYCKEPQCGVCPSCLVRRAAIHAAGIHEPDGLYGWDVLKHGLPKGVAKLSGIFKMEKYARRLSACLASDHPTESILWEYPDSAALFEEAAAALGLDFDIFLARFCRLHQQFTAEWREFAVAIPGLRHLSKAAA